MKIEENRRNLREENETDVAFITRTSHVVTHRTTYWPGSTKFDFPERTRGGTFIRDMTEDISIELNIKYK